MTPDLSDYKEIKYFYTLHGYWQGDSNENYNKIVLGAGNSPQFIATELFSKETLPVGSIIVIDEGWQYRPEGWKTDGAQPSSSRPGNVTTNLVEVTEAWWGDYILRAFNIAVKGNNVGIKNDPDAVTHFKIYIPKA